VVVAFASASDVVDALHDLVTQVVFLEVLFVFRDLESLHKGVLVKTASVETVVWSRHVDTSQRDDVSWGALSGELISSEDFDCARHVADGDLVTWFLDLDVLERDKPRGFDLDLQSTFDVVFDALGAWAFDLGIEFLRVDDLVDFKTARVASVDSDLHAWLYVTGTGDNTFHGHKGTNQVRTHLTQSSDVLLGRLAEYNDNLVVSAQLSRNADRLVKVSRIDTGVDLAVLHGNVELLLHVELALVHKQVERAEVFFLEVDCWLGHMLIDHCRYLLNVPIGVPHDTINEADIFSRT